VPALDGYRGIAILLVLACHSVGPIGAGLGVDLFFCLSGFLITTILLGEWNEHGSISLTGFYRRRILRLAPALVVLVVAVLVLVPTRHNLVVALVGLSYLGNLSILAGFDLTPLGHFWSLAQEEQFYVVWPFALIVMLRRGGRLLVPLLATAFVVITVHGLTATSYVRLWYGPDMHAGGLVLGSLAGVLFVRGVNVRRLPVLPCAVVAATCIAVFDESTAPVVLPVFAVAASCLIFATVTRPGHRLWLVLGVGPLRYLGTISYGLYLWHWPVFALTGWMLGLPIALAAAALSHRYVERPFLARKRRPDSSVAPMVVPTPRSVVSLAHSA
jgi:peptidoglycan/LPS O-acetylase OafA/YrhL